MDSLRGDGISEARRVRKLDCRMAGRPLGSRSLFRHQSNLYHAGPEHIEFRGGAVGKVDHSAPHKGATIVDTHHRVAAIVQAHHPHPGAKRQAAMRCRKRIAIVGFTTGGAPTVVAVGIVGSLALFATPAGRYPLVNATLVTGAGAQ